MEPLTLEELKNLRYLQKIRMWAVERMLETELAIIPHNRWPKDVPRDFTIPERLRNASVKDIREEQARIRSSLQEYENQIKMTLEKLKHLPNARLRAIIDARFMDELSWQEVAERIGGKATEYSCKHALYYYLKNQKKPHPQDGSPTGAARDPQNGDSPRPFD